MVLFDIDRAAGCLAESADLKLKMVAGPDLLLHRQQMTEIRPHAAEPGFQTADRLFFAEAVRNGDDERL